ncbi:SDR family oxidoreductase [Pollutibacter soli]|uniref:SDR family oxidoreductase n=1 Tax=Pollutibacter soli TaxID=3034157 RepID=UPI0030135672
MQHLFITGATGVLGRATALHFLRKGCKVTGLVRNPDKAVDLISEGMKPFVGDLSTLVPDRLMFDDIEVVMIASHSLIGRGKNASVIIDDKAVRMLVDVAKQAGVKQFIYTSIHGVSHDHPVDFFRTKFHIEEYLRISGINYTILRLSAFMEWHAYNLLGKQILEKGKAIILGNGENKNNFIAVRDVVTALNQITGNAWYFNKTISISGPENLSKNEVAEEFGRSIGIVPRVSHVPETALKILSAVFKPFHPGISRVMKLSLQNEHSNQSRDENETITQFGMPPTYLKTFVQSLLDERDPEYRKKQMPMKVFS